MKEINPADVPQMMLDGALKFGMELEFRFINPKTNEYTWTKPQEFYGFVPKNKTFLSLGMCGYYAARFPLPKLRDGDPVVVWNYGGSLHRRHVKGFEHSLNGKITTYPNGLSLWSDEDCDPTIWDCWRLPTKEELSSVGCSEAQITEMLTRWGVLEETQKNKTHRAWHGRGTTRVG